MGVSAGLVVIVEVSVVVDVSFALAVDCFRTRCCDCGSLC